MGGQRLRYRVGNVTCNRKGGANGCTNERAVVFEGAVAQKCDSPGEHALSVSREAELARVSGNGQGWLGGDSAGRPEGYDWNSPGTRARRVSRKASGPMK
jgi:hypothetical protein